MPSKPQGYFLAGMAAISGFVLFAISRGLETTEYRAEEANTQSWEEDGIITKDFPPLYKKKFGSDKIQEWAVWTEYDEATDISTVFTEHGVTGGTITPSEGEIIEEGKGKRTVQEQADGVALSKWRVKRRKGYVEDLDIIPDTVFIAPMTALNFHDHGHKIDFPAIAQRKYDGVRCVADTQLDGTVNLITRRGKHFYDLDHIRDEIGAMGLPPTIRLDGEMYADPSIMSFEESCGLVKKKTWSEADLERAKNIGYHLYDMIDLENLDMPYMERYAFLKALVEKYRPANIDVVDNYEVNSEEDARKLHDQFVYEGYEGLMFRNKDSPYAIDRQSKDLQKYKDFQDAEFKVVGFTEGKGRNKGTVIWKCQMPDNGRTFNVQPKGTAAQRREWFEHGDEYIGKMLTVKFFRLTEKGVPFHGSGIVFRDYEAETVGFSAEYRGKNISKLQKAVKKINLFKAESKKLVQCKGDKHTQDKWTKQVFILVDADGKFIPCENMIDPNRIWIDEKGEEWPALNEYGEEGYCDDCIGYSIDSHTWALGVNAAEDFSAETIIPKKGTVQTMSGKPHVPRKLEKDKDISPEEAGKRQSFSAHARIRDRELFINPAEDLGIICVEFREEYMGQIVIEAKGGEIGIRLLDANELVLDESSIELVKEAEYWGKRSQKHKPLSECDITMALVGRDKKGHEQREAGYMEVFAKGTDYDYQDSLFNITVEYEPGDGRIYVFVENDILGKLLHEPIGETIFGAEPSDAPPFR
jgi:hypothetical protein